MNNELGAFSMTKSTSNQTTDGVGTPNLPPLPKKRRAFICTKCGSQECKAGEEALMHPPCAKCDYLGFAQDCDYNDAEVQAYALEALRLASPQGWISVEERLPEPDSEVLVWIAHPTWAQKPYAAVEQWIDHHEDPTGMGGPTLCTGRGWSDNEFEAISHWQPLPSAPVAPENSK
jgi:hypothetical protein